MRNKILLWLEVVLALFFLDQLTKLLAVRYLAPVHVHVLLPGVFELRYLENPGAAFGVLENKRWVFILFACMVIVLSLLFFLRIPEGNRYLPLRCVAAVLPAGAAGNMADRIMHRYVVDFLYFRLIDFPVFNVADIYVVISCIALLILLLFIYKEEDLTFLSGEK